MIWLIIEISFLSAIWVLGLTIASQEGMILFFIREYAEEKYESGKSVFKPIILCIWCMASMHSIFGYIFAFIIGDLHEKYLRALAAYPIVVMMSSLVSGLTWTVYQYIDIKTQFFISKTNKDE